MSSKTEAAGWGFLRSRRWVGYYALLAVFAIVCTFLGNWQFDRRAEARVEIARVDANYDAQPIPLGEALGDRGAFDLDAHKWLPVTTTGEYIGETYLARGRPGPEGVGSNLISALRTPDGVLFVDRGWIPVSANEANEDRFDPLSLPQPPRGEVHVEVRLREGEQPIPGRVTDGLTLGSIDLTELEQLTGVAGQAYTGAYGMLILERPAGDHGVLPLRPERDEGPHLSYALQWFVFIIIAAVGLAYAARREFRSLNAGSAAVAAQDRRKAERRRRRGPSDSDEEDAWLDA